MKISKLSIYFLFLATTFLLTSCDEDEPEVTPTNSIVDIASSNGDFSDLVTALQKADLVSTLSTGSYTVFAPTNAAFAAAGIDVNALTSDQLTPVLLNHVLGAEVRASSVTSGAATTVGGGDIFLSVNNGVFINGNIQVTQTDLIADNGVIHVIDNVILPPSQNIVEIASGNSDFSTLVSLVAGAGLVETLSDVNADYTVFAPTNAAFEKLFETVDPASLTAEQISGILLYHVIPGNVFSTDLANGDVTTANGASVTVDLSSGVVIKGANSAGSNVTAANLKATNGVVHVIDTVLLP